MCGTLVRREVVGSPPGGRPYSPAIKVGNLVFISGQVALDPDTGEAVRDSFEAEMRQVMQNVKRLVEQAGSRMDDIVKTTVFLTDMNKFDEMNAIYSEYFDKDPPARSTVEVSALALGFSVEIEAIAFVED
jgi:2-iminobutanoate/2-iminopropanoate deaminase